MTQARSNQSIPSPWTLIGSGIDFGPIWLWESGSGLVGMGGLRAVKEQPGPAGGQFATMREGLRTV